MFWINADYKKPDFEKFVLVRYRDSALGVNESPYEVWFGEDLKELSDKNLIAFWAEINPPIPIKNIHITSTALQNHLAKFGVDVDSL